MTSRILPREEWPRLAGTEAETVWPHLNPEGARVIVVEQGGEIVGCWVQMLVMHAECLWIHPSHRGKAAIGRRLLRAMGVLARELGVKCIWTAADKPEVRRMLAHVGAEHVPGEHYMMPVWER